MSFLNTKNIIIFTIKVIIIIIFIFSILTIINIYTICIIKITTISTSNRKFYSQRSKWGFYSRVILPKRSIHNKPTFWFKFTIFYFIHTLLTINRLTFFGFKWDHGNLFAI